MKGTLIVIAAFSIAALFGGFTLAGARGGPGHCGGGVNPGRIPTVVNCSKELSAIDTYIASQAPPNAWSYTPSGQHVTPLGWTIFVNGHAVEQ